MMLYDVGQGRAATITSDSAALDVWSSVPQDFLAVSKALLYTAVNVRFPSISQSAISCRILQRSLFRKPASSLTLELATVSLDSARWRNESTGFRESPGRAACSEPAKLLLMLNRFPIFPTVFRVEATVTSWTGEFPRQKRRRWVPAHAVNACSPVMSMRSHETQWPCLVSEMC